MRLWFWSEGTSERQPYFHGLPQGSGVRGVCGRSVPAALLPLAPSSASHSALLLLLLHGGAARWRRSPPPRPFGSQRGPSSLVPLRLTTQGIQRRAHASSKGFLLANSVTPGLRKQVFFLHVVVFFLLLQSRTPPLTDLLLWRSEAQPHRHWAAFAEIFFCILRRLMARC